MNDEIKISKPTKQQFEHNDGLGDLLREREKLEFSWAKTSVVLIGLLAVILIAIYALFNASKHFLKNDTRPNTMMTTKYETLSKQDAAVTPVSTPKHSTSTSSSSSSKSMSSKKTKTPYKYKVIVVRVKLTVSLNYVV